MHPTLLALVLVAAQDAPTTQTPLGSGADPSATELLAPAPEATFELFALRDGRILFGAVERHDEPGLGVRRLDNGGYVELPWTAFDPTLERELRLRYGYLDVDAEELMVTAQRIPLVGGQELVGRIVQRTEDALFVKQSGGVVLLPTLRIDGAIADVAVPAGEIFTREELYAEKAQELGARLEAEDPAEAAAAHVELARYSERIRDFVRARDHYQAAFELDPTIEDLAASLNVAERKAEVQEQVDELDEIDRMRGRGQYGEALLRLDRFAQLYPRSPLAEDRAKLEARTIKDQVRAVERVVHTRWHHWVARVAGQAVRDMDYEALQNWLCEGMHEAVLAAVTAEADEVAPGIDGETVMGIWQARERPRTRRATYGEGTWLLGKDAARAEIGPQEEESDEATGEKDAERADLQEKIAKYLKNQERQRQQRSADDEAGIEPADWWDKLGSNVKSQWVRAYYAEHCGDVIPVRASVSMCRECGGLGFLQMLTPIGGEGAQLRTCPLCFGVGVTRRITYR